MKSLLLLFIKFGLLIGLFTSIAQAGTPDQDPVVANLRSAFLGGRIIVAETDLKFGTTWSCTDFFATKDQFYSRAISQQFQEIDGIVQIAATNPTEFLAPTSYGLTGIYQANYNYNDVFRVTPKGDLIEELSLSQSDASSGGWTGDASVANPAWVAMSYIICPAN